MSQQEGNTANTEAILKAMDDLGPADAATIAEQSGIPYSTVSRKLREWGAKGEIGKTDRGSKGAHWFLLPTDQPLPNHLQPANAPDHDAEADRIAEDDEADDQPAPSDDPAEPADVSDAEDDEPEAIALDSAAKPDGADDEAEQGVDGDPDEVDDVLDAAELPAVAEPDDDDDPAGGSVLPDGQAINDETEDPAVQSETPDAGDETTADASEVKPVSGRRPKNYFHDEGMLLLRAHPDRNFTVGEICKLVAAKEIAAGAPAGTKVSTGAMANAMHKAAAVGEAMLTNEKPARFRAA